ncbi:MAG: transposase, partial [Myxococcaceae bacterium]
MPFLEWTPPRNGRRCAFLEGFSLHANSRVHENDRQGLARLAKYGARGPFSLERLSQLPNGDLAYRMKRPQASGAHVLVLSPLALLRKLAALVPPPRVNLVRFFGVFAPNARVRKLVVPKTTMNDALPAVECHGSGEVAEPMRHTPTRPKRTSRILGPTPQTHLRQRRLGLRQVWRRKTRRRVRHRPAPPWAAAVLGAACGLGAHAVRWIIKKHAPIAQTDAGRVEAMVE